MSETVKLAISVAVGLMVYRVARPLVASATGLAV